jgi:hypothetical protein
MIQPNPKKRKITKKKTSNHPNDDYKDMVDPATGKKGTMGGEGRTPPFTPEERSKMPKVGSMGSGKNGKTIKKAKSGTSLGMKSVKAGYDNNPSITRADIITAAKGKAKSGAKLKKQAATAIAMKKAGKAPKATMKAGGKMTKCKYGCK